MSTETNIEAAFNEAAALHPEITGYNTVENGQIIATYIFENWGAAGAESASAWEIAFAAVKDQLTPIPDFVMPLDETTCATLNAMTGSEVRLKYQRDVEFRKLWDRFAQMKKPIATVDSGDPYKNMTVAQYRSIPASENAKLYATNASYKAAVDRLVTEGRMSIGSANGRL